MLRRTTAAVVGLALLSACRSADTPPAPGSDATLRVAASFAPIEEILRAVGGSHLAVIAVTAPGADAHDVDPGAKLLEDIHASAAVFYIGRDFQPSLDRQLAALDSSVRQVDLATDIPRLRSDGTPAGPADTDVDPHLWLAPNNMAAMTAKAAAVLVELDPDHRADFLASADRYVAELTALDAAMTAAFTGCETTTFLTEHRAFAYLAGRFGLTELSISGVSPDGEPSAKELRDTIESARVAGVKAVFAEANAPATLVRTAAADLGVEVRVLQTVETLTTAQLATGTSYVSAQYENLAALQAGLGCQPA